MTNAPEGAFKIPNFIDQLDLAKFGSEALAFYLIYTLLYYKTIICLLTVH